MPGTLTNKRSSSPIRSGGGNPYRMVRIRCESGVSIKIPESGFKNPDPDAFAFSFVWFADPDHVRIRNHLHFLCWWIFFTDPDPRIRIRVPVTPNSFRKILNMIFLKENSDPRLPLSGSIDVFTFFALKRWGTRFEDWDVDPDRGPDPRVRPGAGPVVRCGTAQQRTTDPASASGSAFRTVRYASAF